ncbi:PhoX family phosphatase [Erythrobacter sp. QSSC1-22B]|uniref:PhoX family protein n=1 Tax=Erythrobacter sp. QSSC1-22B TaxID=1860125 RepID=UPI000AA796AE|nr:PhoX family phosphatase [Erythrobacter sp. QSSC1-22B]
MPSSLEQLDFVPSNPTLGQTATIGELIDQRYSRRGAMKGMLGAATIAGISTGLGGCVTAGTQAIGQSTFVELKRGVDTMHHVAPGHDANILIRWGDPLMEGDGDFNPLRQSAEDQERRFGYNNDYIGFLPLPSESRGEQRGLLCVNHEYSIAPLMLPGAAGRELTAAECEIEKAAHGGTIVEVVKCGRNWRYVQGSGYNRRITGRTPGINMTGPAASSPRLVTSADPTGRSVVGTLNNCAGGITPWGSYLLAEENFNGYFSGTAVGPEAANHKRYGVPGGWYEWAKHDSRFDVGQEPNEPNRFGWIVEIDPMDPTSTPKKRTALGRFKHEGAESVHNRDGRVVVYSGDDQVFDYVYKFVTAERFDPARPETGRDLLDAGTLYVARFDADGTVEWMPLIHGAGPLTAANGFADQADVLIETRRAADLLGATPMDRPEDVEPDPRSGRVYVMLTNNTRRDADNVDPANPRAGNAFGHIIEIVETDGDFTATRSTWNMLVRCGDPAVAEVGALWGPGTSENGWFGSPDNVAIDSDGRLWVSTDGKEVLNQCANGVWRVDTEGPTRGRSQLFFRTPTGAELCGPRFIRDEETLFVAVQHPADDGEAYPPHARPSTFADPSTRWPDFDPLMPPRPSVLTITRSGGGKIGT